VVFRARERDTESLKRKSAADQPRPALGRRPWFALLRRARSLRRFAFAIRRESVARSGSRLTLLDPANGWRADRVSLFLSFWERWRGVKTGMERVLMRTNAVHGRGLDHCVLIVGLDSTGRTIGSRALTPGGFVRFPGAVWVLELPDGHPLPVSGARLGLYARRSERQTDPMRNANRQSR
jgi:hypothetical protein